MADIEKSAAEDTHAMNIDKYRFPETNLSKVRPILLFCKSPIVFLLSTYLALEYGLLYLFFTTIPSVFKNKYDFSTGLSGLAYLGIGIGFMGGLVLTALTNNRIMAKIAQRNGGKFEPEMRLPMMIFYAAFCPISFFWYGWTTDNFKLIIKHCKGSDNSRADALS
ncbi:hypothetical protein GGI35DRAFT_481204 [Trichoderma velutinum]